MGHGWPDDAGVWANQLEYFCAEPHGEYFCVAPTMFDYHPDVAARPRGDLLWEKQVAAYHAVVEELGLSEVTLVIHDFGSVMGFLYAGLYPAKVAKVVAMDIGLPLTPGGVPKYLVPLPRLLLPAYMNINIRAFETDDDALIKLSTIGTPCHNCAGITAKTGWTYQNLITPFETRIWPDVPLSQFESACVPHWPDEIPMLFFYGACEFFTGP